MFLLAQAATSQEVQSLRSDLGDLRAMAWYAVVALIVACAWWGTDKVRAYLVGWAKWFREEFGIGRRLIDEPIATAQPVRTIQAIAAPLRSAATESCAQTFLQAVAADASVKSATWLSESPAGTTTIDFKAKGGG